MQVCIVVAKYSDVGCTDLRRRLVVFITVIASDRDNN